MVAFLSAGATPGLVPLPADRLAPCSAPDLAGCPFSVRPRARCSSGVGHSLHASVGALAAAAAALGLRRGLVARTRGVPGADTFGSIGGPFLAGSFAGASPAAASRPPRVAARAAARPSARVDVPNAWQVLGVARGSTTEEVKAAFRTAVRDGAHPDKGGDTDKFVLLQRAFKVALIHIRVPGNQAIVEEEKANMEAAVAASDAGIPEATMGGLRDYRQQQANVEAWKAQARRAAQEEQKAERRKKYLKGSLWDEGNMDYKKDAEKWLNEDPKRMARKSGPRPLLEREELQHALNTAVLPEAQQAWMREAYVSRTLENETRERAAEQERRRRARAVERGGTPTPPKAAIGGTSASGDLKVGHRMIRVASGDVKVDLYQDYRTGARYYISPISNRKVAVPK
mmetsp:Transcript_13041/g.46387  ORF Transcript_13041/g.46387 Transcript_13041/m.46387 type:complete len:400 (+) Transcript_13041:131-1330(+)